MISNFSVKSQWLYLLSLGVKTIRVPDSSAQGRHYGLVEDVLPHIVTPLDKKLGKTFDESLMEISVEWFSVILCKNEKHQFSNSLASQVSHHPCINFVGYIVPCNNAPLYIYTRNGHKSTTDSGVEAFISPRYVSFTKAIIFFSLFLS